MAYSVKVLKNVSSSRRKHTGFLTQVLYATTSHEYIYIAGPIYNPNGCQVLDK